MPSQARPQSPPSNATGQPPIATEAQSSDSGEADAPAFGDAAAAADLQAEIAMLRAKSGELADQYLRAKADAENARRRADDEVSKARKFAVEAFAESMLPVLDSLEAGLAIKNATVQQIQDGTNGTLQQLKAALERNKVLPVDPKPGEKFDPNQHHAIGVTPAAPGQPAMAPNSVVTVLQKGYTIAERVLRPALVMVSAPS
ncbi:MAG: nucleotide exchange factor GrpE [Burkholderiaceae bacterium]